MQVMVAPIVIYNRAAFVGVVIFYKIDLSIRQNMLARKQPKHVEIIGIRNHVLMIIVKQVRHAGKRLARLIRPARTIPLTARLTFEKNKLLEIILVRGLVGPQT